MIIHVVQPGETLNTIAEQYGVTPERLIIDNELPNPENLVVGQSMIVRIPTEVYTVQPGDTLASIASSYDITTKDLLRNNPWAAVELNPGQTLVITFEEESKLSNALINGYAYPFIDRNTFRKTLPFLTYQSLFTYGFTPEGDLVPLDDSELIGIGYQEGVRPIMMLAPVNAEMNFDSQIAHDMFVNEAGQSRLIDNIVATMQEKGYVGLDIDFEFILPEDRQLFINFISNVKNRLEPLGLLTFVALAPKTSGEMTGLLYEAHDYPVIGAIADIVLLMTYEWGYLYGPPMATAPLNNVRQVLEYGVSVIPREKILMGIPNYAYDWALPFVQGESMAEAITNQEAIARAARYGVTIEFDEAAQAPFYYYTDEQGVQHVVWFDDARSMNAKLGLIPEFQIRGAGVWQIMNFFPALWMVVNELFNIEIG
ncbi:LysM peptidoglycan-binding domain-containing protein [Herbinix luporum]|uniref:LysM peptidoglycan-binding domain-containing protein n=1 Tax=Herbinix luporum TaxID=1679721 RepID=UPI00176C88E5|nr:glycosyl hydrolase family 18 protein [Bacillota bacterium]HHT57650.1 LysM peptidoglycan-binding domain-containing protein [Herbinix luporum]